MAARWAGLFNIPFKDGTPAWDDSFYFQNDVVEKMNLNDVLKVCVILLE